MADKHRSHKQVGLVVGHRGLHGKVGRVGAAGPLSPKCVIRLGLMPARTKVGFIEPMLLLFTDRLPDDPALDSVSYRFHNARIAVDASDAVAPCTGLHRGRACSGLGTSRACQGRRDEVWACSRRFSSSSPGH
jgi:hypothetical protein